MSLNDEDFSRIEIRVITNDFFAHIINIELVKQ